MIPNIIHFIFGLEENYGGQPFSFFHFLSIYTAFKVHQPDRIYFHYEYEPIGKWWEKSKEYLTLNKLRAPTHIFDNKLKHFAHKADVIRLEKLMEHGGCYLDIDVLSVNSFDPLRKYNAVMGIEYKVGLCNAVILSEKNGEFISNWYDQYRNFDGISWNKWNYHSVRLPMQLSKKYPQSLHIVDEYAFFYPMYSDPSHWFMWKNVGLWNDIKFYLSPKRYPRKPVHMRNFLAGREWQYKKLCQTYCIHLWQSEWFETYLQHVSPDMILKGSANFPRLIRKIIPEEELVLLFSS